MYVSSHFRIATAVCSSILQYTCTDRPGLNGFVLCLANEQVNFFGQFGGKVKFFISSDVM